MIDLRDIIFQSIADREFKAIISVERDGCLSGVEMALKQAEEIGVRLEFYKKEGDAFSNGDEIATLIGTPKEIAIAEEKIIGMLSKFSGIATAAKKFLEASNGKMRIVSGSVKKMPPEIKAGIRHAIEVGGASCRIVDGDMIYLDKNYIRMFGSIQKALEAVKSFEGFIKIIQIRGEDLSVEEETAQALHFGADILMVDTGSVHDLKRCLETVNASQKRNQVQIAFSGGIRLDAINTYLPMDIDALCIGKEIVDAPLLDMKLDVIDNTGMADRKGGLNLLEKTELWINNISLSNANLTQLAGTVAKVLGMNSENILVVDVRPCHITLDILEPDIPLENITGREREILDALSGLEGVNISEETYIHSNGILGLICLNGQDTAEMRRTVDGMVDEITGKIARRVIIFSTGFEVKQNLIQDTNSPYLKDILEREGYEVIIGPVLEDDMDDMVFQISDAVSRGYGLILTTGGVGAEDKDKTVESIKIIDPEAETPYIMRFHQGTGRHVKDGVKIAVSFIGPTRIIALPGPNDEVRVASRVLMNCLKEGCGKKETADRLAHALAQKLIHKKHAIHDNHKKEEKHGL